MANDKIKAFSMKCAKARSKDPAADLTGFILSELKTATEKEFRLYLFNNLAREYDYLGNYGKAEKIHKHILEINPDHPLDWMEFAMHFHYWAKDLKRALQTANKAVAKAHAFGDLLTKTHAERIRIAVALERYDVVEESLRTLAKYDPPSGSHDRELGFEKDIINKIPQDAVDKNLLESYRRKARS